MLRKNKDMYISAATVIGSRDENQDNFRIDDITESVDADCYVRAFFTKDKLHYACLCDGIGGAGDGKAIAKLTCQEIGKYLDEMSSENIVPTVMNAIDGVQIEIQEYLQEKNERGGCTIVLLVWSKGTYYFFSIGDSLIYHYNRRYLMLKNELQNAGNHYKKTGRVCSEKETKVLMNYLGRSDVEGSEMVNWGSARYKKGHKLVLSSDGIAALTEKELALALHKGENARDIVQKAAAHENSDNCTAIVVEM